MMSLADSDLQDDSDAVRDGSNGSTLSVVEDKRNDLHVGRDSTRESHNAGGDHSTSQQYGTYGMGLNHVFPWNLHNLAALAPMSVFRPQAVDTTVALETVRSTTRTKKRKTGDCDQVTRKKKHLDCDHATNEEKHSDYGQATHTQKHSQTTSTKKSLDGNQVNSNKKHSVCSFKDPNEGKVCTNFARDATGRCIKHGGGHLCSVEGCERAAQGSVKEVRLCKSHGGGKRCTYPECTSSARGNTDRCHRHRLPSGGKPSSQKIRGRPRKEILLSEETCSFPKCTKLAELGKPRCRGHRYSRICEWEGCTKCRRAQSNFCISHGGGVRCSVEGCNTAAAMRGLCNLHGGCRKCSVPSCTVNARPGKQFCHSHRENQL